VAAIEKGDDAWLFVDLGSARLRSKQHDKALEAYERALSISPTPAVWTKIAWDLAEGGQHLDRAAELSARSEKAIIESTQKLDLKTIRSADLDLMARLAWTWDAAGWVQFQKGNTAKAESYVDAAWLLSAEAETAFHLGRIYEKDQARQADALSLFLQAEANGEHPVKEVQAAVTRLAKGADTKMLLDAARRVTVTERAVHLKSAPKMIPAGEADFLVMVGDDNLATDVRFLYGDETMRVLAPALLEPGYPIHSPSHSGVRLVLGVGVKCVQDKGCFAVVKPARLLSLTPAAPAPR
jgi:tetratricopeptide (TPR) repeat protein